MRNLRLYIAILAILLSMACGATLPTQAVRVPSPVPAPVPLRYASRFNVTDNAIGDMYWRDNVLEWRVK